MEIEPITAGPFIIRGSKGREEIKWEMFYKDRSLGVQRLSVSDNKWAVIKAFQNALEDFREQSKAKYDAPIAKLKSGEEVLRIKLLPQAKWFLEGSQIKSSKESPFVLAFQESEYRIDYSTLNALLYRYQAPQNYWISHFIPEENLTLDYESWQPPSGWVVRHVIGQESLAGLSGSKVASLIGVSARNVRAYMAAEGARNRYDISFSAWHFLLQRLGITNTKIL